MKIIVLLTLVFISCNDNNKKDINEHVAVTGVSFNNKQITMAIGQEQTMDYIVFPNNATNQDVQLTSDEPGVVSVNLGKVKANAEGAAIITVSTWDGGFKDYCEVIVPKTNVTGIRFNQKTLEVAFGQRVILPYTIDPATASNKNVIWSSSKPAVAEIDNDGFLILKASGSTVITATTEEGGFSDECELIVTDYWLVIVEELYNIIRPLFALNSGLYREYYNQTQISYLWPLDAWITAMMELQKLGIISLNDYATEVAKAQRYHTGSWQNVNIPAYAAATNGNTGTGTRFYDDNSIIGINFVDAYRLTGNPIWLERSRSIIPFLKSGEDSHLGGGMWWNEAQKNPTSNNADHNKPTCSNGYGVCFLLNYYKICPQAEKADVLDFAKRLYNWLYTNLRDPADNTYWNALQALGTVQTTKWTYNSGVMIKNGILLHEITGEQQYLNHAKATAIGSYNRFVSLNPTLGIRVFPDRDPWFNTKLFTAYIDIVPYMPEAKDYVEAYIAFADYAYKNSRTDNGLFFEGWAGNQGRYHWLLMQAAVIETFGAAARYKKLSSFK